MSNNNLNKNLDNKIKSKLLEYQIEDTEKLIRR